MPSYVRATHGHMPPSSGGFFYRSAEKSGATPIYYALMALTMQNDSQPIKVTNTQIELCFSVRQINLTGVV
jgi:hypothetical protein